MAQIKKFFYDLETTGLSPQKSAIHQIAFIIEIDGVVKERKSWHMKPFEGASISSKALEVGGVDLNDVMKYTDHEKIRADLMKTLAKYVSKFDKRDKFHLAGYNNRYFDDRFLRAWFERSEDPYFGSWFWADSLDVMVLASSHLVRHRHRMENFKLATVAEYMGIEVKDGLLHDARYDVDLTRDLYNKITLFDLG
jgi:DNA polymerase-3 subunit epsilon